MGRVVVEPTGDEAERRGGVDVVVWDGASLAGPRDVLDGAWLALRPEARAMIDAGAGGKLLLIAPPPLDAAAEAARGGVENLARTLSIEWARYGIRTAALLPGAGDRAGGGRRAGGVPRLARGRLLLGLPLRPGGRVSDRYRVTSLDSIEPLPGPGSLRWLAVRHELGIGSFGTNAYVAQAAGDDVVEPHTEEASGHEELYFVARGSATFTLDGEEVHAPAGTYVFLPDPEVHRRAVADEAGTTVMSFGAPRGEAFTVSGWEARFRATAIRERDPEQARALYEEGLAARPAPASGRTTTWPAGMRSTAAPRGARAARSRDRARR